MYSSCISFFGGSFFRTQKSPYHCSSLLFSKRVPSISFQCHRYYASAVADVTRKSDRETLDSSSYHPWPEWMTFVDRLKSKGYFTKNEWKDATDGETSNTQCVYNNMNLLKDACISFARDRYDIFKLLSTKDIHTIVNQGCPNILRKAVNSAKRLRAHLGLDEGDVCGVCNLRDSCDRAYVIPKENEAAARTVDLVRTLLFYALDPLVISSGEKSSDRELIDASAKKLLSELVELSETPPAPEISKPVKFVSKKESCLTLKNDNLSKKVEAKGDDWICPKCNFMNFARNSQCLKCKECCPERAHADEYETKKGDWNCPECNFMNFARNAQCLKCKEDKPRKVHVDEPEMRKGDWTCPECNFMNFSKNLKCLKCKTKGPPVVVDDVGMKKGDWNCAGCGFMNFSANKSCLRCRNSRPKRQLNTGEWECPSCDYINFRRNTACLKCRGERPKEPEYDAHTWRTPHKS